MTVLYAVLATYAATQVVRFVVEALTGAMMSRTKLFISIALGFGFCALQFDTWQLFLLQSFAAIGGATVVHRLHRYLGALGDAARADVLRRR